MKLLGGNWSRGDVFAALGLLLAMLGLVAAFLAVPGMPKVVHWDGEATTITKEQVLDLYKSDQRSAQQAIIAKNISNYLFAAENVLEALGRDETTKVELHFVVDPYNDAIGALRQNEYVYRAVVQRYWDKSTVNQYENFFKDVLSVDKAFHQFNDEFGAVETGAEKKADEKTIKPLIVAVSAEFAKLQQSSKDFLASMSK
jgi:hypothetical protein